MKILALEFSSPQRSVAVADGDAVNETIETGGRSTSALAMIEEVLRDAKLEREQIECLAIGIGPGSYTGIRAAIALAQGWQLARNIKILGISSVESIARQTLEHGLTGKFNIVIDAQRNEFYLAQYEIASRTFREIEALRIVSLAEIQKRERAGEILVGPEVQRWFPSGKTIFPSASAIAKLAMSRNDFISGEKLEPIYLRETTFVKAPKPKIFNG
jgi:tRNA threonylcarbamoyl adenosine modification protein YeaZ